MFAMIGLQTTVIIPGVVGHFFCGAASVSSATRLAVEEGGIRFCFQ